MLTKSPKNAVKVTKNKKEKAAAEAFFSDLTHERISEKMKQQPKSLFDNPESRKSVLKQEPERALIIIYFYGKIFPLLSGFRSLFGVVI